MSPFLIPIGLQGLCMLWDEFYFHNKRGLGNWERWGHPLDTISMIIPTGYLLFSSSPSPTLFIVLSAFSCLFVTKDEWVHSRECEPFEQWLHAVLFVLHPVVLWSLWNLVSISESKWVVGLLVTQIVFFFYQIIRWNVTKSPRKN